MSSDLLDLVEEEIRRSTRDGSSSKNEDEENFSLATKARKRKGKKSSVGCGA